MVKMAGCAITVSVTRRFASSETPSGGYKSVRRSAPRLGFRISAQRSTVSRNTGSVS